MSFASSRSGNSGQKSKRSFNSNSANNDSDSSNGSKKKKSSQKTLGMAWGANSLSSSRSSFRKSPFSDFGSYMGEKIRKLDNQFAAEASNYSHRGSSSEKPIFHGVSIFVDGFTIPSSQELRGYMLKHGGRFENYFSRHRITHIICSNLPDCKIKNLRSFSGGLPVVKPTWILDCVAANKLLNWVAYQLDQLPDNQPKLSAFFAPRSIPVSMDRGALMDTIYQEKLENMDPSKHAGTSECTNSSEVGISMKQISVPEDTDATMIEESRSTNTEYDGVKVEEPSYVEVEEQTDVKTELQSCVQQPSSLDRYYSHNQNKEGSSISMVAGPSNKCHSILGDPNFVENYFKNSRLHFIGTWRSRYRKRYPISSSGFKSTSSHQGGSDARKATIIHIDMDCFFASVAIKNRPELQDRPVAVCHSDNPKGTAEISSANYPARAYGISAGMFVRDAKALCPHLVILPYNFEAYEEARLSRSVYFLFVNGFFSKSIIWSSLQVADQFYDILHKHCSKVQAVSCDEAFLDVTDLESEDPELLASEIRKEIFETTGCSASAGIASNMLMARLATRAAKPAGQCNIPSEKVDEYLHQLPITVLPGIGYALEQKLKAQNILTCGQLRLISKESLQKDFGMKTGEMLWNYSRGFDNRLVGTIQESKSIGAEVNWGIRFRNWQDSQHFLLSLCKEVQLRLHGCGVQGRTFSLKIKKRRKDAKEPAKYMGCGDCENLSHSVTVPVATDDLEVLQRITKQLFGSFHLDIKDIRGIGLQVSKLERADAFKQVLERNTLKSWITSPSAKTEQCHLDVIDEERSKEEASAVHSGLVCSDVIASSAEGGNNLSMSETSDQVSSLPPLCNLDMGVVECLPPEVLAELDETYGGKLVGFIAENKDFCKHMANPLHRLPHKRTEGQIVEEKASLLSDMSSLNQIPAAKHPAAELPPVTDSWTRSCNETTCTLALKETDLMPLSLSQVDSSVLHQLPEELRADILDSLPEHRRQVCLPDTLRPDAEKPQESLDIRVTENESRSIDSVLSKSLWIGNPPRWVDKFKASNFLMLNVLAEMYYRSRSTEKLSSILQCTISEPQHPEDASCDVRDEAIYSLCEVFKQYIKLNIEVDLEEIYICFRLLKRLTIKSEFFLQVFNIVLPYLQASVGEHYGGDLRL